jgi:adenosylcobinamide-GDP ribazoletransferase
MKSFLLAIQFLTIIPVSVRGMVTEREVSSSSAFFPLVGAIQGLIIAAAALLLSRVFPQNLVAGLAVLGFVLLNGGFHLDGLADTFDAFAVKSSGDPGKDRLKRLAVMKDSTTGAIGVVSIVLALLLTFLFISALFEKFSLPATARFLFLMPVFSKWTMVPVMAYGQAARNEGLGKLFIEGTGMTHVIGASFFLAAAFVGAAMLFPLGGLVREGTFLASCSLCLCVYGALWSSFCKKKFGGLTGDTVGASGQMADLIFLALAYGWF